MPDLEFDRGMNRVNLPGCREGYLRQDHQQGDDQQAFLEIHGLCLSYPQSCCQVLTGIYLTALVGYLQVGLRRFSIIVCGWGLRSGSSERLKIQGPYDPVNSLHQSPHNVTFTSARAFF
jgi:hypothetical protein